MSQPSNLTASSAGTLNSGSLEGLCGTAPLGAVGALLDSGADVNTKDDQDRAGNAREISLGKDHGEH